MAKRLGVVYLILLALTLVGSAKAQTVAGSIVGTAVDQSGAVVPGASVTLMSPAMGTTRTTTADAEGVFHFPNVNPDFYTVTIDAQGFKKSTTTNIEVGQGETRDLGKVALEVGAMTQEVTVTAAVTPVQTSSSEKSTELTGSELNNLPLRGRDLFGSVKLVPGVIDTTNARDVTNPGAIGGVTINGNSTAKNFTVDGITDIDTGSNGTLHYEPNMDSIQEVKVLSSNYQAEFGRNSGGTITVVTKSGTQQFHGSGWWNYRNNWMNANDWFNKNTFDASKPADNVSPRAKYRYNVEGYSVGGPIYIPNHFNAEKKRLFFFFSQEYTGQLATNSLLKTNFPTKEELGLGPGTASCPAPNADFSNAYNSSGQAVILLDPMNGNNPFPNNCIPASRIDPQGLGMLEFFPVGNYAPTSGPDVVNCGALSTNGTKTCPLVNFQSQVSGTHARRNDTLRIDVNPTSKLTAYFRYINDHDDMASLYNGIQFVGTEPRLNGQTGNPVDVVDHPNPGHGYAVSAIWTISPTLVNEATVAEDWNTWSWYLGSNQLLERSRGSKYNVSTNGVQLNPAILFPLSNGKGLANGAGGTNPGNANDMFNILPGFSFGSGLPNETSFSVGTSPYFNANPIWTVEDNLSKVVGQHQFKMGFYWEENSKIQPAGNSYTGSFQFAPNSSDPLNTAFGSCPGGDVCGDGYANGLLGYYQSYTQQTNRTVFNVKYQNLEFYVQDNWRATRRLTLDVGIRFYHQQPQYDSNATFAEFVPSLFSASQVPALYEPACLGSEIPCSAKDTVATYNGNTFPGPDIADYVPGTGSASNGMKALGTAYPYTQSWLAPGPRIGFAYDVFGNGKTAVRGGFGAFFNRLDGNQVYGMSGAPPVAFTQADNYDAMCSPGLASGSCASSTGGLQAIQTAGTGGLIAPTSVSFFSGPTPWIVVRNASLGVQQNVGFNTVVDVAWTGNFTRKANLRVNLNPIPFGADFTDLSPVTGQPLNQNGSVLERTVYPGWQDVSKEEFLGFTNYNSLAVSVQRRLSNGLLIGVAYTFSKALQLGNIDPLLTPAQNNAKFYGPAGIDRRQNLLINYSYDLPSVSQHLGFKPIGLLLDHWTFSGLTTLQSGAPFTVNYSGGNITGSGTESGSTFGPRPIYLGGESNLTPVQFGSCTTWGTPGPGVKYIFNPCAFAAPQQAATFNPTANGGNGGLNYTGCSTACLGSEGQNMFYGHGLNNFDLTLEKRVPIGKEGRRAFRFQFQAYNAFNHPQFTGVNTSMTFNTTNCAQKGNPCNITPGNSAINNTQALGASTLIATLKPAKTGNPSTFLGQANADTGYRILSGNIRFEF